LVHFLFLGAVLFVFAPVAGDNAAPRDDEIVVTAGTVEQLAMIFQRTWQRPPRRSELDGLIDDYVREEAAYREGMAMGLDYDDTIIRRRIRQKLEFIAEDLSATVEPTDDDLVAYLEAHPEDFRIEPRISFQQIYFNPKNHQKGDVEELAIALNGNPMLNAAEHGDRIMLERAYSMVSSRDIASIFGRDFSEAIVDLEPGSWVGPIRSGYGFHLVRVDEKTEGRLPDLDHVRHLVRREWENARREETVEQFYNSLVSKYDVTIEWPKQGPPEDDL
jgi:hypothetical protein